MFFRRRSVSLCFFRVGEADTRLQAFPPHTHTHHIANLNVQTRPSPPRRRRESGQRHLCGDVRCVDFVVCVASVWRLAPRRGRRAPPVPALRMIKLNTHRGAERWRPRHRARPAIEETTHALHPTNTHTLQPSSPTTQAASRSPWSATRLTPSKCACRRSRASTPCIVRGVCGGGGG